MLEFKTAKNIDEISADFADYNVGEEIIKSLDEANSIEKSLTKSEEKAAISDTMLSILETVSEYIICPEKEDQIRKETTPEYIRSILDPLTDKRSKEYNPIDGTFDLLILIEECAELSEAIAEDNTLQVLEESADVYLCTESLVYITGIDDKSLKAEIVDTLDDKDTIRNELSKAQRMVSKIIRGRGNTNTACTVYVILMSILKSLMRLYEIKDIAMASAIHRKLNRIIHRIENDEIN